MVRSGRGMNSLALRNIDRWSSNLWLRLPQRSLVSVGGAKHIKSHTTSCCYLSLFPLIARRFAQEQKQKHRCSHRSSSSMKFSLKKEASTEQVANVAAAEDPVSSSAPPKQRSRREFFKKLRSKRKNDDDSSETEVFTFLGATGVAGGEEEDSRHEYDEPSKDSSSSTTSKSRIPALFKRKSGKNDANESVAQESEVSAKSAKSTRSWTRGRSFGSKKTDEANSVDSGGEQRESAPSRSRELMTKVFSQKEAEKTQIKAVYNNFGGEANTELQVEKVVEGPPTLTATDHVLIKVQASTVTLNDCLLRRGFDFNVFSPLSLPATPGYDVVGHIMEVGEAVEGFLPGERVAALVRSGGNARYASVPAAALVKIPAALDSGEAAALVTIYTTAYQALRTITSKQGPMFSLQGKKVLILGGMDGVGQALIQMCKKAKATIYAPAPSSRHIYLKKILGVTPLPETDWLSDEIKGEIDFVFDGVCEDSVSGTALKSGGELVRYGNAALLKEQEMGMFGAPMSAHASSMYSKMSWHVHTVDIWASFCADPETFKSDLSTLAQSLKWNKMKPHIAKRVSLSEVGTAMAKLEKGGIRGTIVCFPWRPLLKGKVVKQPSEDE